MTTESAITRRPESDPPQASAAFNLHASPETRAKLGWVADRLPQWAGRDVVVVSAADLKAHAASRPSDAPDHLLTGFIKTTLPDSIENLDWWQANRPIGSQNVAARMIMQHAPFATDVTPKTESNGGVCMIALPDLDDTKKSLVGALTNHEVDPDRLPGDDDDWLTVALAHEAVHCKSHVATLMPEKDTLDSATTLSEKFRIVSAHTLGNEIDADRKGISIYREEAKAGRSLDAGVPGAFRAIRAIDSINNNGSILLGSAGHDHATNAAVALHGEEMGHRNMQSVSPGVLQDTQKLAAALNETTMLPQMMIGMTLGPAYVRNAPDSMLRFQSEAPNANLFTPGAIVKPEDFTTSPQRAGLLSGYALAAEKPELMYAATKALQERGAFRPGTLQDVYASQYLDAVEKLKPDLVKPEQVAFFHDEFEKIDGGALSLQSAVRYNIAAAEQNPETAATMAALPNQANLNRPVQAPQF